MKKCPQCNNSYGDENLFCLDDGTPLTAELQPTVAFNHHLQNTKGQSFVVNIGQNEETPTQVVPLPPINNPSQPTQNTSGAKNYLIVLLLGLLIGGGLVLATIFLMKGFGETKNDVAVIPNANRNQNKNSSENKKSEDLNKVSTAFSNANETNSAKPAANDDITNKTNDDTEDKIKREEAEKKKRLRNFNGRTIALNVNLRFAPTDLSESIDVLPNDEPIKVGKPATIKSPWYRVVTISGKKGWIHGDWIKCVNPKTESEVPCPS